MIDLLLEVAWKSAVTSGVALLLLGLLRKKSAAERSLVALAGVVTTLLLAPLVAFGPRLFVREAELLPDALVGVSGAVTPADGGAPADLLAAPAQLSAQAGVLLSPETAAVVLYAVPAAVLMILLIAGVLRLFVLRARAEILMDESWLRALVRAQHRMNFKHGTALLVSKEVDSPLSWGLFRPTIVLNDKAAGAVTQAEAIIAHELAHVSRSDWLRLVLGRIAVALFWFNPLVWILFRHSHQLSEEAADDAVLAANVGSVEYASLLVDVATHDNPGILVAANGVAPGPDSLKQRIARILDPDLSRRPIKSRWATACVLVSSMGIVPVAALAFVRPPATLPPAAVAVTESPQGAAGRMELPRFGAVQLRGGAYIIVRHGRGQQVRLVSGLLDPRHVSVTERGQLLIDCGSSCSGVKRPVIEVVSPNVHALAVDGGGTIRTDGEFPLLGSLDLALNGGGTLDARGMEARSVAAALNGGGTIMTHARDELAASVNGGGAVRYRGSPEVDSDVRAGGRVEPGGT